MNISSNINNITANAMNSRAISSEQAIYNQIKGSNNTKEQLMKTAQEFESIFITKIMSEMENTVDKSGSLFEEKSGGYMDTFKPDMLPQMGHDLASNPNTSFGFAKMSYKQEILLAI